MGVPRLHDPSRTRRQHQILLVIAGADPSATGVVSASGSRAFDHRFAMATLLIGSASASSVVLLALGGRDLVVGEEASIGSDDSPCDSVDGGLAGPGWCSDVHVFAGSGEDAQDLGAVLAGAAEPVRHARVELGDLAGAEDPVLVAEHQA